MTNLNLIPPAYKDRMRLQRAYSIFKTLLSEITLYTIFLAISLLLARYVLETNFERIVGETTLVTTVNRETERKIADLNKQISLSRKIQRDEIAWPDFFVSFAKLVPTDVTISSMKLNAIKFFCA